MLTTILSIVTGPNGIFAVLMAAIIAVVAWSRRDARKDERARQAASEVRARDISDEIDDAVAGRSPDENRGRLKKWGR